MSEGNYIMSTPKVRFISYSEHRVLNVDKIFRFYKAVHEKNNGLVLPVIRFQSETGLFENLTFDDEITRDIVYERICRALNCVDIGAI